MRCVYFSNHRDDGLPASSSFSNFVYFRLLILVPNSLFFVVASDSNKNPKARSTSTSSTASSRWLGPSAASSLSTTGQC